MNGGNSVPTTTARHRRHDWWANELLVDIDRVLTRMPNERVVDIDRVLTRMANDTVYTLVQLYSGTYVRESIPGKFGIWTTSSQSEKTNMRAASSINSFNYDSLMNCLFIIIH